MSIHALPPPGWELADPPPDQGRASTNACRDPEFGPDTYNGVLFPVFMTAQIPCETVSRCISRNAAYQAHWDDSDLEQLYLVTSASGKPSRGFRPTFRVEESFQPPAEFIGKSVADIRAHFCQYWQRPDFMPTEWLQLPMRCFVVLDEQTLRDDTALLVSVNNKDSPMKLARSEFDCICQALDFTDQGDVELDEQEYADEGRGIENGLLVYRLRWFRKKLGQRHGYIFENGQIDYDDSDSDGDTFYGQAVDENGFRKAHPNYQRKDDESLFEDVPEIGPKNFHGKLYPVFLTAQIPVETLIRCLSRCADYQFNWDHSAMDQLYLVPDDAGKQSSGFRPTFKVDDSSTPPTAFLGWTVEQVRAHFIQHWQIPDGHREWPHRPNRSFVVLDERTLQDDTAFLVAINGQEEGPMELARCEFDCICMALFWVDEGSRLDDEEFEDQKRGVEDGIVVYRVRWYKKQIAYLNGWQFENDEIDFEQSDDDEDFVYGVEPDENGFLEQHPNYQGPAADSEDEDEDDEDDGDSEDEWEDEDDGDAQEDDAGEAGSEEEQETGTVVKVKKKMHAEDHPPPTPPLSGPPKKLRK